MNAWEAGYKAGRAGEPMHSNPYTSIFDEVLDFTRWFAGWCEGRKMFDRDNKEVV